MIEKGGSGTTGSPAGNAMNSTVLRVAAGIFRGADAD